MISEATAIKLTNAIEALASKLEAENDVWLNLTEAAELSGYTKPTIYKLANTGKLNPQKIGKRWMYKTSEIMAIKKKS